MRLALQARSKEKGAMERNPGPKLTAYVVPPHCRARHKQTTPGRRASRPRALSCRSLSLKLIVLMLGRSGIWSKKTINTMTTPPKGRLM